MNSTPIESDEQPSAEPEDGVSAMLGVGKELWSSESGDRFVDRLRAEDAAPQLGLPDPLKDY